MQRLKERWLKDRQGNVLILSVVWIAVIVAGCLATADVGSGLAVRLRLSGAMSAAATSLEQSMRYAGPTRDSAVTFQAIVQRDLGDQLTFRLANFDVRRGGRLGWEVTATGYVLWPIVALVGSTHDVVIADQVGSL
jgi:hypothetical protein